MSDLKIGWDADLMHGDLVFENNDIQLDEGLGTSVYISLFTDRRATDDDILPDDTSTDKRGFWADSIDPFEDGDQIGSRLWLLERSATTEKVMSQAEDYILEALEWMITDGIAKKIDVEIERLNREGGSDDMLFSVAIHKMDGNKDNFQYNYEWENT